jgi:putative membrane protein
MKNPFRNLERANGARLWWLSLIGVLIIPLIVAGGFLAATWNSSSRMGKVKAAVVNHDHPVKIDNKQVPLGRQLAGGLVKGKKNKNGQNFDWQVSDGSDARDGLASGRYAAVVTIPSDFSSRATSYADNDAQHAKRAEVEVQTSNKSGITDAAVAQAISQTAIGGINDKLSRQYLSNLYLGFNRVQSGVSKSAHGAGQLANSAKKLDSGIDSSADGAKKLAGGDKQLSTGAGQLADGITKLQPGAERLASGADGLDRGASRLSNSLNQLSGGTKQLPAQTKKLNSGVQGAASGARGLRSGIGNVDDSAKKLGKGAGQLQSGLGNYADAAKQHAAGLQSYTNGVDNYLNSTSPYAKKTGEFAAGVSSYTARVRQAGQQLGTAGKQTSCPANMSADECRGFTKGAAAIGQQAQQTLTSGKLGGAGTQLAHSSAKIKSGSQQLTQNSTKLKRSGDQLAAGAGKLHTNAAGLQTSAGKLASGADKLSAGAGKLDSSAAKLAGGLDRVSRGTAKLANSAPKLQQGISAAADGSSKLSGAAGSLGAGAHKLSGGIDKLGDAGDDVATGAQQSAHGSARLAGGLTKLSDGSDKLAHGSAKLHHGLTDTAKKMPSYSSSDRKQLSTVAAQPVHNQQPDDLFGHQSTTTLLMAVALWIGGLVTYLIVSAIPRDTFTSSKSSLRLTMDGLAPGVVIGAVQAGILSGVLTALLNLSAGQFAGLLGFGVFAGVTFAVANHALAALLGGFGRLLSVAVLVVSAAAGLTGALPAFFLAVRPFSPITPALDGMRSLVTHGPSVGGQVGIILAWLVAGGVVSLLAVLRRRKVSPEQVQPAT